MKGKAKCRALKEIRRQIAAENDIPYVVSQCTYQGDCKGTCPKCESELRYLERELEIRKGLGRAVAVVGISTSVCAGLTACSPVDTIKDALGIESTADDIAGNIQVLPEDVTGMEELGTWDTEDEGTTDPHEGGTDTAEPSEEENIPDESMPEESTEPEETEDMTMGEILPPETAPEETISELAGDISLPDAGTEEYGATGL